MRVTKKPDLEPIPGYRLIEPLGSGGFGEVWKCEAPGGLIKAIKFVQGNADSLLDGSSQSRDEHRAIQRIKDIRHPFLLSMERVELVERALSSSWNWPTRVSMTCWPSAARRAEPACRGRTCCAISRDGRSARSDESRIQPATPRRQAAQPLPGARPHQGGRLRSGAEPGRRAKCGRTRQRPAHEAQHGHAAVRRSGVVSRGHQPAMRPVQPRHRFPGIAHEYDAVPGHQRPPIDVPAHGGETGPGSAAAGRPGSHCSRPVEGSRAALPDVR